MGVSMAVSMAMHRRTASNAMRVLALFAAFAALAGGSPARADGPQCTFTMTPISFGTVDVQNGRPYDATGIFSYSCTGDAREIVRICPSFGLPNEGTRWMTDSSGHKLFFNLYTDEARTDVWGSWFAKVKAPSIDAPVGRREKVTGEVTAYARVDPGQQNVPPGVYKSSIAGRNSVITYGYASQGACIGSISGPTGSAMVTITARVGGDPSSQPIVAPDATHPVSNGSPQSGNQGQQNQGQQKTGFWQKMADNAQYQQQKNQGDYNRAPSGSKPLCKMSDSDVHLVDGNWSGPNCIAVDANGKPVHPEEVNQQNDQEKRAEFIESHSCMTTDGADKANVLAGDCEKVTSAPHKDCNIQEHTCDEIRKTTQKGCWGMAAGAPDFCLTQYR